MAKPSVRPIPMPNEGSRPRPDAAYFLSIGLRNVRCFGAETQHLDLSDGRGKPARWTIILGENGTGKTTILQALACLFGMNDGYPTPYPAFFSPLDTDFHGKFARHQGILVHEKNSLSCISPKLIYGKNIESAKLSKEFSLRFASTSGIDIEPNSNVSDYDYPFGFGYGAARRMGRMSLAEKAGYQAASLFSESVELIDAEEWLLRMDYSSSKPSAIQDDQRRRLESVKDVLNRILPDVKAVRFSEPSAHQIVPTVEFDTPYGWVHLRQLSQGYQAVIAWMVDFASGMVDRYPDSPDPLAEPAVVLVDEIDLHLHPTWQRKLIGYLTERFPNTQFIATAHSPLIVQAASDANIALLKRVGDHVEIINDVEDIKNWRVDQILTSDLFGLESARPPQIEALMKRRGELLTRPRLTKAAKAELAEIEAKIGDLPVGETAEQMDLMKRIDETLTLLKDRQDRRG